MSGNRSILVCTCDARRLVDRAGAEPLVRSGSCAVVPDLCRAAAEHDPVLAEIAAAAQPVVHACNPRAVRALFAYAGHPLPERAELHNLRRPDRAGAGGDPEMKSDPAWFPVIDADRCTNCGQCESFCLFGVYDRDDENRVRVAHPEKCKNNCPACARICPETAIIFPKAGESPIDGADIADETERKSNVKLNVDELLGDDVYAALNARKARRRALLNQRKVEQALKERRRCSGGNA